MLAAWKKFHRFRDFHSNLPTRSQWRCRVCDPRSLAERSYVGLITGEQWWYTSAKIKTDDAGTETQLHSYSPRKAWSTHKPPVRRIRGRGGSSFFPRNASPSSSSSSDADLDWRLTVKVLQNRKLETRVADRSPGSHRGMARPVQQDRGLTTLYVVCQQRLRWAEDS